MFHRLIAAALLAAAALPAAAAPLGLAPTDHPLIRSGAALADYDPVADVLSLSGLDLSFVTPAGAGVVLTDFVALGGLQDGSAFLSVFAEDSAVDPVLAGDLADFGVSGAVLELLFSTTEDDLALFGDRILLLVDLGAGAGADPLGTGFFEADATASITTPVPLPPAAALLVAALAAGGVVAGHSRSRPRAAGGRAER